jgi:uncharacterized membrane protein
LTINPKNLIMSSAAAVLEISAGEVIALVVRLSEVTPVVRTSLALTIIYGLCGAVSVSLGKGLQKYGVEVLTRPREIFRRKNPFKLFVWILGTAGVVSSAFFLFAACAHGPLTIVSALSGTGLVALVLFCAFVLKEPISKTEIYAITAILVGTVLVGFFEPWAGIANRGLSNPQGLHFSTPNTVTLSLVVTAISLSAAVYSWKSGYRYFGVIFGSISGFCGGISVFYQKGAMLVCGCNDIFADIPAALKNPFFYLFAASGILDFVITQYALIRAKAITVVPCYQSFYIAIPILGGIVAYYDSINVIQVLGIALLLSGVIRLSIFIGKGENEPRKYGAYPDS